MTRSVSITLRLMILAVGAAVIGCAWALWPNGAVQWRLNYFFGSLMAAYLVFFYSMFFMPRDKDKSGSGFVAGGMLIGSVTTFALVSVVLGIVVWMNVFDSLYFPLIIQGISLFFFLIQVFLTFTAGDHISAVGAAEKAKIADVAMLRSLSQSMVITSTTLPESKAELKKQIAFIADELRYMAPTDNAVAKTLEARIASELSALSADLSGDNALAKANEIILLIKQRKVTY
ncbi:MAG: hypothetical protein MJ169_05585 [Treponema sp.]|nr:hypothetical protein [Treponema sp.]